MSAQLALQKAIFQALANNAALTALIGAGRVHDDPPDALRPPYVLIGTIRSRLLASSADEGEEHRIAIAAWSTENGNRQAALIAEAVRDALQAQPLAEAPYVIANLEAVECTVGAASGEGLHRADLVFRAVTETR
jgi:hypothetical protein